jgi:signal transduction histidine kinase
VKRLRTPPPFVVGIVILGAVGALAVVTALSGMRWVNTRFPGFLLLRNRVVASVSLPGWPVSEVPAVFQATVVAVDGRAVATTAEIYAQVATQPAGTPIEYVFERRGTRFTQVISSRLFTWEDGLLLFGVYLFNGIVFSAIGVGVWMLSPGRGATRALLGLGLTSGVYALTAIDLYGPHLFFRLHAVAESFLPASYLYLAMLFPVRRVRVRTAIVASHLPCVVLALVYQLRLDDPARYPAVHELATFCLLVAGLCLLASVVAGYVRAPSDLVRHRVRVVALGILTAFALPSLVLGSSALADGEVPVNVIGFTAFLFPLSIAYAVHKRDLFAIDALVQRGIYYATLSGLVTIVYFAFVALGSHVFHVSTLGRSPIFSLAFTLAVLFVLPTVRNRIQYVVDRMFGRQTYDAQAVFAHASRALNSTLDLKAILEFLVTFPASVLQLEHAAVFKATGDGFVEAAHVPERLSPLPRTLSGRTPLAALMAHLPHLLVRSALPRQTPADRATTTALFDALGAELIVPLACQGTLIGFLACGPKRAGTSFAAADATFLRTFANQAALSLQNARTYRDLAVLNQDLEQRVADRTHELEVSKDRITASLAELEEAYLTLQARQEQLVAAEKMAAFGRLAAGIAHEINTPLGASLNGLRLARELIAECDRVAVDETTTVEDWEQAVGELRGVVTNVEEWTAKAVSYIRTVKAHGRAGGGAAAPFDLGRLLEFELHPLLMHRLRRAGGQLEFHIAPNLPELFGDGARLGQVLTNLITNGIDASEGLPADRHQIVIEARQDEQDVVLAIRDRGTGIPADVLAHVFDEFFTTKPHGKGTGLGLSIARNIISGEFGGTLACTASGPEGTTFTIRLPIRPAHSIADDTRSAA